MGSFSHRNSRTSARLGVKSQQAAQFFTDNSFILFYWMFLVETSKSIYVYCSSAHVLIYRYKICSFDHLQSNCTFVRRLSLCAFDFFLWLVWVVGVTGQKAIQVIWDLYGHATFLLGRTLMHSRHTEEMVAASSSIFFKTYIQTLHWLLQIVF